MSDAEWEDELRCWQCNARCEEPYEGNLCAACARRRPCPHGSLPAECNACFVDSDLAYDAGRER